MDTHERTTAAMIQTVFAEQIAARQGTVTDVVAQGGRLLLRSILPDIREVGAQDRVQGGVALRSNGHEAWVNPYVFREVCSNGAVWAQSLQSHYVMDLDERSPDEVLPELREAIQTCASAEAFAQAAHQMRSAKHVSLSATRSMVSILHSLPPSIVAQVMRMFFAEGDKTAFGLGNALTATARDTPDEDLRWRLEELGGGVFASATGRPPSGSTGNRVKVARDSSAPGRVETPSTCRAGRLQSGGVALVGSAAGES